MGGRGVFGGGQDAGFGTRCPRCACELGAGGAVDTEAWARAIDAWWKGGDGALACRGCGVATPVTEWPADWPLGFGYTALEFWHVASLTDAFVEQTRAAIGVRTTFLRGKL